ncbi:MAG: SLC13 family permease [Haloarculaceae archaeon]
MPLSTGAVVVFALLAAALVLFVTELLPPDVTAIAVLVSLAVLQPYTEVGAADAIAGFASPATVTIVAMYILSAGVQETGVVRWVGAKLAALTRGSHEKLLAATVGISGVTAGFVNNTPVVAVFVPMVTRLADENDISPSKLLLPLSYASMLGGTLTLIGSATNLLASDLSETLLGRPFTMFTFTKLGVIVLVVGGLYLYVVGSRLTPARVAPGVSLTEAFDMERHLAVVVVREESPLVGEATTELMLDADLELDVDLLQVERDGEAYMGATRRPIEAGDRLTIRADRQTLNAIADRYDLRQLPREAVTVATLTETDHPGMLAAVVVPDGSGLVGETLTMAKLKARFDTTVLAVRRGGEVIREHLDEHHFRAGDTLLLQTTETAIEFLVDEGDLVVSQRPVPPRWQHRETVAVGRRAPLAVGILAAVVLIAALTPLPIVISALGGVVAMVATGCLSTADAYDAVSWPVVFLLAGVLPLGIALQRTGGAAFVADLLAAVVTPVATVVVLIPVAVATAADLGANPFAFLLGVMFGASAAFSTPVGYQTNLMVYGPGGYRFTDYARVGVPLQLGLAVVVSLGIAVFWPL